VEVDGVANSSQNPAATTALEPPPGLSKHERTEWFKKNLPAPAPKDKKQQQKKIAAGAPDDAPPSSNDSMASEVGEFTPTVSKPKVTGKPSTGNLAGKLQADDVKAVRTAAKKSLVKREEAFRKITWLAHLPQ
jgi:hypothetical protein